MDESELDRLLAPLRVEPAPPEVKDAVRAAIRRRSAGLVERAPADLQASVRAHVAQANARRTAAVRRRQLYAGVALAASVVLGVAIALFVRPEPDLSGISTLGVEGRVDNAVRERICTLARAGNYREAQAEFDKLVRRGGEPATAAQVDALCRP